MTVSFIGVWGSAYYTWLNHFHRTYIPAYWTLRMGLLSILFCIKKKKNVSCDKHNITRKCNTLVIMSNKFILCCSKKDVTLKWGFLVDFYDLIKFTVFSATIIFLSKSLFDYTYYVHCAYNIHILLKLWLHKYNVYMTKYI